MVALIPGIANNKAFIQIITNENSYNTVYPVSSYKNNGNIQIGNCIFSKNGIKVDIDSRDVRVSGEISYSYLTPIKYDIMGVFKYFPMECRHGIISMYHTLNGSLSINGKTFCFTDGVGYIEKDSGTSFPKTYLWIQCNDFKEKCSIMVSIADIPFMGLNFRGCICVIYYRDREYRLATYLGVKIACFNDKKVVLRQGKYRLEIDISKNKGSMLYAPDEGVMTRTIHECASCKARFKFFTGDRLLFDFVSDNSSFELV